MPVIVRSLGGSSEGTLPRVPEALRGGPEVESDTKGQENPISPRVDKSNGNTFIEVRSGNPCEQTPCF